MSIFRLPDLGEGLPDAEIHEWFIQEGDSVEIDQPMVSMETAKAVVEVPCPQSGKILKLFGKPGDVIQTGAPLVEFAKSQEKSEDQGTVVGHLEQSQNTRSDTFHIGSKKALPPRVRATPAVRLLAKQLGIDLTTLTGSGDHGLITRSDVEKEASREKPLEEGYEPLRGVRRAMLQSMEQSHKEVVPVSIFDEADIQNWSSGTDITVTLIRAIIQAVQAEPALNAWFDGKQAARKCLEKVNIGLAMDSAEGLFVPVIEDAANQSDADLRKKIDLYKQSVRERTISPDHLKGATITLSNFGKFAGRFANPIIVPPMVAILGVGRIYQAPVVHQGNVAIHNLLPLSLSFDHRAVTGGEATRFLAVIIDALQKT
jgi:2-oxoisovalerate dehydrogenase E2 component (dihydrolipoyl transacylase)